MEKIASFTINHLELEPGIYVSRKDKVGAETITTFDIRMHRPNREPVMNTAEMHTIEHLGATFIRNDPEWKDQLIYWGPMGCLTGFYIILKGNRAPKEIFDLILKAFRSADDTDEVPGASAVNCGNCRLHNLEMAKWYADRFASYLEENRDNPAIFEYPKSERLVTDDGRQFFDS
jgi:S-ribosylhomocysteine lyase